MVVYQGRSQRAPPPLVLCPAFSLPRLVLELVDAERRHAPVRARVGMIDVRLVWMMAAAGGGAGVVRRSAGRRGKQQGSRGRRGVAVGGRAVHVKLRQLIEGIVVVRVVVVLRVLGGRWAGGSG